MTDARDDRFRHMDTNLDGMEPQEARDFVLAFIQTLKEVRNKKAKVEDELELWTQRVKLAEESGKAELHRAAVAKVEEIRDELGHLDQEEEEYGGKVAALKTALKRLEAQFRFTIDTELLIASLDMLVGEEEKSEGDLSDKLRAEQAQLDLEELKKKMREQE